MQIILVHPRFTRARSITLGPRHLAMLAVALAVTVCAGAALLYYLGLRYANELPTALTSRIAQPAGQEAGKTGADPRYVRQNIAAMAIKVGEMQAQMMRLDALGRRVQGLAGVKPEAFDFGELPGRGGAEPAAGAGRTASTELSLADFQQLLGQMAREVESRADYLNVVESALMNETIQFKLLPTVQPVDVSYNASGFGARIDPFNGRSSFHEGIDFPAPTGTPVVAAAGGVVITAEYHHQYGNMLEIDHGNGIVTRYAHCSRLLAKLGDIVKRGQHVGDIGTSGRSTGPHLHFEVAVKGVRQDPNKFLLAGGGQGGQVIARARRRFRSRVHSRFRSRIRSRFRFPVSRAGGASGPGKRFRRDSGQTRARAFDTDTPQDYATGAA